MKLLNSLYTIVEDRPAEGSHDYVIKLDPEHFIYKAHFPGEPITPGVCILQTAQELMGEALGEKLEVSTVKNVKFLRVISPLETPVVCYSVQKLVREEDTAKAQVTVTAGEDIYAKLSLICRIAR